MKLTDDGKDYGQLAFSPDGQQLIFSSMASGSMDLWKINVDGSNLEQLTNDAFLDMFPDWTP